MRMLLACPFCRELFDGREDRVCPECGVSLVRSNQLAPSPYASNEPIPSTEVHLLPVTWLGGGRGLLAVLSVLGLVAFCLPWVCLTMPDVADFSGIAVSHRLGWSWGAGVAWFVLLPTVVSRRSLAQMRGARVATAFLSAVPGLTVAILLSRPPHGAHNVPVRFTFGLGLYATAALSLVAMVASLRFGGRGRQASIPPPAPPTSHRHLVH